MNARFLLLTFAALLTGCMASVPIVPPGAATAELSDRLTADEDETNERAFVVESLDGVPVKNLLNGSTRIAWGSVVPYLVARQIQVKSYVVGIRGRHLTSAPIVTVVRSANGTLQDIHGTVRFTPAQGRTYRVTGELSRQRSAIWIEDFDTKEPVTDKVIVQGE